MSLHLSALIALMRGLSMSSPRCLCPVFCMYLSVEACLSPSLPFAVFALRLVGCDNVCCSSLVLSIAAGSGRFPAVNSQSIYVPFGLVNSKKNVGIWGVDVAAQDTLLQALDASLDAEAQASCTGPSLDGCLTATCLEKALKASPKGTMPGRDGLPYEFYQAFWALLERPM